ncbi:Tetratricopeptide-like helical domain [Trinorchestia longiramus]|nr:Tetratricopeptide-like helical domain [Trinorchestia longiramus]
MASSKYLISDDTGIPKWKVALAIGGAAALCAALYYKQCVTQSSPKDSKTGKETAKTSSPKAKNGVQTPIVEDTSPLGIAKKHKGEGNNHYRVGNYLEAIECYDAAIKACPPEATQDLATFYQNKAAANELLVSKLVLLFPVLM